LFVQLFCINRCFAVAWFHDQTTLQNNAKQSQSNKTPTDSPDIVMPIVGIM
jgi:hypothetical protein